MPTFDEIIAAVRLSNEAPPRRGFTVAKDEAIIRLRERAGRHPPWDWTLALLRAGRVLSPAAVARVAIDGASADVLALSFDVPGTGREPWDLTGLLAAVLQPDAGPSDATSWRRLVARAINDALAQNPEWMELQTPVGARRWERAPASHHQIDPYVERFVARPREPERFVVRVSRASGPLQTLRGWLRGIDDPIAALDDRWRSAMVSPYADDHAATGMRLGLEFPGESVALGEHGRWWRDAGEPLWLVRDGVRWTRIDAAIARVTGPLRLGGLVECPSLALTVEEDAPAPGEAFDLLIAWLLDAQTLRSGAREDGIVHTASEVAVPIAALSSWATAGDLPFVWRHRADAVPESLRSRVLALWPLQAQWLREHHPELVLVPMDAFESADQLRPVDLTGLAQGTFEPIEVAVDPLPAHGEDTALELDVQVYVHRFAAAAEGRVMLLWYDRRVATQSDPEQATPGTTIVIRLPKGSSRPGPDRLRAILEHTRFATQAALDSIVARVLGQLRGAQTPWRIPLLRRSLETLDGVALELRYARDDDGRPRLRWRDAAWLPIVVARTTAGVPRTLEDALIQLRDVGGVVLGHATRRWYTLESDAPPHQSWVVDEHLVPVFQGVLGPDALWEMPTVPEARPHPQSAEQQRHLLLGAEDIDTLRPRAGTDRRARDLLLGHLLVARALGADTFALEQTPLLRRFDPRAPTPRRFVTLDAVLAEDPSPALVPPTAGHRGLAGPVLEVTPGVACLLSETTPLPVDAPTSSDHPVGPDRADLRRPDPHAPPLCTVTVADRLAAGALVLAPDRTGVSLWARGLRVGDFRLPSPLREISGRLWLTDAGIAAGHAGILALALEQGRQLVGEAQRTVSLHPPNSPARLALQTFLERIREAVSGGDRLGLAGLFTTPEASEDMPTVAALPANPSRWLQPLLRHALARPIHIETAWLSWKALRVLDAHAAGRVELGLRHDWIKRATREGADPEHVFLAAALSVAFAAAEMGGLLRGLQRIMATARALE